ncbi:unnamed protein product [Peniophora sp. CBMAI 1063]|nr:unnamed protein product [Peniophora sp. CBMAI 1063]
MDQYSPLNSVLSSVPLEQRSRVIRSARKLEQVLGTNAFLVESSASRPLQVIPTPPRTLHHKHSQSLNAMDSMPAPVPRTRSRGLSHNRRRLASIFDLDEEELRKLGMQARRQPQDLPKIIAHDLPRSSLDSADSSPSTVYEDAASAMFTHSNNSSVSTLPTDDSRPASPVKIAPVTPTAAPSPRTPKRKRSMDAPPLFIEVQPVAVSTDDVRLALSLTPVTAPVNVATPTTPRTPTTPTAVELAEQRSRKLTKISRTLGENVPPELVFSAVTIKKNRRVSLSSAIDVALPDSTLLSVPRLEAPPLARRQRSNTASRPHSRAPFATSAAESVRSRSSIPPMPVYASGPARVAGETWVGSWNRPDIQTVQTELRALRRR